MVRAAMRLGRSPPTGQKLDRFGDSRKLFRPRGDIGIKAHNGLGQCPRLAAFLKELGQDLAVEHEIDGRGETQPLAVSAPSGRARP